MAAQHSSAEDSAKRGLWPESAEELLETPIAREQPVQTAETLAAIDDSLALGERELSHLDDCYALISSVCAPLAVMALAAGAGIAFLLATGRRRLAGTALTGGPAVLAGAMAALGIWAAFDFNGFFSVFHQLLFPQGNWTFPADSLLICMLPSGFWVSMGALWLAVTLAACIIAMLLGRRLRKAA